MKNFLLVDQINIFPLRNEVQMHPELWDQHKFRTTYVNTPHVDVSDIWIRYTEHGLTDPQDTANVVEDVAPIWYPEALNALPSTRDIVTYLMARVRGYELGRVLITKVKPGGRILPHRDADGAYTQQKSGARYHVVLQGLPGSMFRAGDEQVNMQTGQIWWFNHCEEHEVFNNSTDDRIHLLIDMKLMP